MPENEDTNIVSLIKVMKTKGSGKNAKTWCVCGRMGGLLYFQCISILVEMESTNFKLSHIMHTKLDHRMFLWRTFLLSGC